MSYLDNYKTIDELKGQTLTNIEVGNDEVVFTTKEGKRYRMYHEQDCCELVTLDRIEGNYSLLMDGTPITVAREEPGHGGSDPDYESVTFTDFVLATSHSGGVSFHWIGSSNGYYSESVYFIEI